MSVCLPRQSKTKQCDIFIKIKHETRINYPEN